MKRQPLILISLLVDWCEATERGLAADTEKE
jgi:hypothetical protein